MVSRQIFGIQAALLAAFVFGNGVRSDGAAPETAKTPAASPIDRGVGQPVSLTSFAKLKDLRTGQTLGLNDFRGKVAAVLVFSGVDCPIANLYAPRLVELSEQYKDKGVLFLLVNSNAHETADEVLAHAKERKFDFPVLKDTGNVIADLALAERTPEAVVIDLRFSLVPKPRFDDLGKIRYRGAIDDQYALGARKPEPTQNYLRNALDDMIAGRAVAQAASAVPGCPIDKVGPSQVITLKGQRVRPVSAEIAAAWDKARPDVEVGAVNYAKDVAPILQAKCQGCHRPGQVGPFPLSTYDDARRWSNGIAEVIESRRMPPWHADPRHGEFVNDRSLSAKERSTLLAWVDQDCPLGDPKTVPAEKTFTEGWTIGKPHYVVESPIHYTVPLQGWVDYVRVRTPSEFREDKWIQAIEAQPSARAVVHHIILYCIPPDGSRPQYLVGYAPGDLAEVYPPGTAKKIPAGSELLFELHYTPNGTPQRDRSRVGIVWAKPETVKREAQTLGISSRDLERRQIFIPARDANFQVTSDRTFGEDVELLGMMPHMHVRGKDFRYTATYPDGRTEVLLDVPAYDFAWQSFYWLSKSKMLPAGTRIDCVAHFDNSSANPNNPDPDNKVYWGDQTFEEMMIGFIEISRPLGAPKPAAAKPAQANQANVLGRLLGRLAGPDAKPEEAKVKAKDQPADAPK